VRPGKSGQLVVFERRIGGTWTLLKSVRLGASGTVDFTWKPPLGTSRVRVRAAATAVNGAASSAPVSVTATGR
jgi:phage-related protein